MPEDTTVAEVLPEVTPEVVAEVTSEPVIGKGFHVFGSRSELVAFEQTEGKAQELANKVGGSYKPVI